MNARINNTNLASSFGPVAGKVESRRFLKVTLAQSKPCPKLAHVTFPGTTVRPPRAS